MRFRKLRITFTFIFGWVFVWLLLSTVHGYYRHQVSVSYAPYVEEFADWDRYLNWVLFTAVAAIVPLLPWPERFSLRTLLIVTTLLAVVLGAIVYLARR